MKSKRADFLISDLRISSAIWACTTCAPETLASLALHMNGDEIIYPLALLHFPNVIGQYMSQIMIV